MGLRLGRGRGRQECSWWHRHAGLSRTGAITVPWLTWACPLAPIRPYHAASPSPVLGTSLRLGMSEHTNLPCPESGLLHSKNGHGNRKAERVPQGATVGTWLHGGLARWASEARPTPKGGQSLSWGLPLLWGRPPSQTWATRHPHHPLSPRTFVFSFCSFSHGWLLEPKGTSPRSCGTRCPCPCAGGPGKGGGRHALVTEAVRPL